ncbi:hypothetical protein AURDEDRAFT_172205 [Auricularia subglabra TFB-10046 SS5]|nr:hypothetical protein AURDEDRAFT_172205 [Auricularia subglabra TFB-10046 SS5]
MARRVQSSRPPASPTLLPRPGPAGYSSNNPASRNDPTPRNNERPPDNPGALSLYAGEDTLHTCDDARTRRGDNLALDFALTDPPHSQSGRVSRFCICAQKPS